MQIELLPSTFGNSGHIDAAQRLTSFVIDDCVAVDAGSLALASSAKQREQVRDVIITHPHIDHIATLPIFIDDLAAFLEEPIRVHATAETIETIERDILNGTIYPRFSKLRGPKCPLLEYVPFKSGREFTVKHLRVTAVPVNHTVPTVGLLITDGECAVAFSSDTAETMEFWLLVNQAPRVDALVIEASFPDSMAELARVSKHLTPAILGAELRKFTHCEADVLTVHLKPMYREALIAELEALAVPRLRVMEPGHIYSW